MKIMCNLELVLLPLTFFSLNCFFLFFLQIIIILVPILYFQICQYLSTTETRKKRQSGISSKKKKSLLHEIPSFSQNILFLQSQTTIIYGISEYPKIFLFIISRKLLFNEFIFVITYRYAMNCRLRRQEKRDNLESQVRNMCLFCSVF